MYTGLAVGDHVFAVRATDPAGQVEAIWVEHEWTVVPIQAPQTTLTDGPPAETVARTASFAFAADEAGSTFACSLDGAPFTACDVPAEVAGLGVGFTGVAALVGLDVEGGALRAVALVGVVVVCYAVAPLVADRWLSRVPSTGVTAAALAITAPFEPRTSRGGAASRSAR